MQAYVVEKDQTENRSYASSTFGLPWTPLILTTMDPAMARMLAAARSGRPGEAPPAPGADAPVPDKCDPFEIH